jgi:hypothetical protein
MIGCKSIPKVLRNLTACCVQHGLEDNNQVNILEMLPSVGIC